MKEQNLEDLSNRPSGKMVLIVMGSLIVFLALLYMMAILENLAIAYFGFSIYLALGLVMVFRYKIIGTAIYRANLTIFSSVWRHVFKLSEEKVHKRITEFKAFPIHGYTYHLVITFIIGLALIAASVWSFIIIYQNKFF
jgi:hypothetical protein